MGRFRDFLQNRKSNKKSKSEERASQFSNIIRTFYGGDYKLMAWNYAQQIYDIPEVRNAINTVAEIFSTMPIYHKIVSDTSVKKITKASDDINYVLGLKPNPLQNSISFWQSCINTLLLNNNLFIEPIYDREGRLQNLYVLPFKYFTFELQNNVAYVKFLDAPNGGILQKYNLDDLIYISRFCSLNGGDKNNLGLYDTVIQALSQQILNVCNPNKVKALLSGKTVSSQLKKEDKKGVTEELAVNFANNVNGVAYIDDKWQITPINWQENDVNKDLMKLVINTVYNYFGMNDKIVTKEANEFQMETFISTTIKPLADQFEQELTAKLFTRREIEFGHKIEFDVFALSISTLQAKVSFFGIASRNGIASIDEMRSMIGLAPLPDGLGGKIRISADCVDIKIADKYQLGKLGLDNKEDQVKEVVSTTNDVEDINNDKKEESNARDSKKE